MAERLDSYEFRRGPTRRASKYEQYLDGDIHRLVVGEDIPSVESARRLLAKRAKEKGLKVRTSAREKDALIVQAYRSEGDA